MIQSSEMSTSQTKTAFYGKRKHKKSITRAGSPEPPVKKCETPRSALSNSDDSAYFSYVEFLRGDDVSDMETPVCADLLDSMSQHKHQDISTDSLRIHYKYLKSEIDPHEVEDHLYQRDAIDSQFYETCRETPNRSRRVDMLIKNVHYVAMLKDSKILRQFVDSLHATDQCHVVEKLAEMFQETSFENNPPEEQLTGFLKEMKSSIYENVEPKYFIDDLVENGAISFNDHEDISAIACRRDRVACYMNKVNHARKSGGDRSLIRKIIQPMIHAYPKLYEEYTCRHKEESIEVPQVKVGSLVRVRCHIKGNKQQALLRHIERNCVKTFYENPPNYEEWLENIVEECRCSFEKLTISSVVIHLRTTQGDSLYRVFKACKEGKALQWLLSLLDEHDMTELKRLGPTKLQIKIVADENGNGDNLHQGQDCLCVINRNSILKNYKLFPKHVNDIDKLIELMCEQNLPGKEQLVTLNHFKAEKRNQKLFDFLLQKEIPQIYFCVLQKHIQKSGNSAFLQEVSQDDIEDTMSLSISDILEHEDYIKEEIDIRYFTPTIFSRETKTSNQLQRELQMCKSRRCRIDLLLRYLQEEDDISWFWDQLKVSQKYIWNAILSSKESKYLSERDLLALNILNDRIVDEIDPLHLKTWMNDPTIQKLHFPDFERVSSRRTRTQCMMNRLSVDTVGLVIMALRRSGYEHVVEEIKAGSLSNRYECPRLLQRMQENKCVFHYQFEMNFDLPEYDYTLPQTLSGTEGAVHKDVDFCNKTSASVQYPKPNVSTKGYKRQLSNGSVRDSESGIYSGSEGVFSNSEVREITNFEDEGIGLGTSGSSDDKKKTGMPNRLALGKLVKHYHDETGTADGTAKLPDNNLCETPKATNVFFKPSRPEHPKDKSVRRRTARYSKCHLMPLFIPKQDKIYGWKHGEPGAQAAHFANVSECKTFSQTCQDPMQTGNPEAHKALSNTLSSKQMTKEMNYPSVAKCHSETTLSDLFDISCCLKNNSDERSLSSPPHGRDRRLTSNENKHYNAHH